MRVLDQNEADREPFSEAASRRTTLVIETDVTETKHQVDAMRLVDIVDPDLDADHARHVWQTGNGRTRDSGLPAHGTSWFAGPITAGVGDSTMLRRRVKPLPPP